jgi:hypothetical protein
LQTPHLTCGRPWLHSLVLDNGYRCKALVQEILLACQLGSSNRFLVTVDAKHAQSFFVLLWVLHTDTLVRPAMVCVRASCAYPTWQVSSNRAAGGPTLTPAARVQYLVAPTLPAPEQQVLAMEWSADDAVLDHECAPQDLVLLAEVLAQSTLLLPPSRRTAGLLANGYLLV